MLKKIELNCAYCGKKVGIGYIEDLPCGLDMPLVYCSLEHDEADTAKFVEEGMKTVRRLLQKRKNRCLICGKKVLQVGKVWMHVEYDASHSPKVSA